jgi:membrane protease YdiL (CAAX protease family)
MSEHDPEPRPEPPLVIRVDAAEPPLVIPMEPPRPRLPRPGFWQAVLLTATFGVVLFGTVFAVVGGAILWLLWNGGRDALRPPDGAASGSVSAIPPDLIGPLAWSFPIGYAVGLAFTVLVLRFIVGRGWTHEVGLRRLPPAQLGLGLLALPGFVILSDVLAQLLFRLMRMEALMEQDAALGDILKPFHWSFAVLAIGVGPGIVEELWCRGFLGRGFISRYGWAWGVALTSLFFGMLHLFPPPYVLVTAAMGAGLHFTYIMSRSLWVPICLHLLNNSFAALVAVKAIPAEGIERGTTEHPVLCVVFAVGLLVSAGLAMWTARARLVAPEEVPAVPPYRGVMVPPPASGYEVLDAAPRPVWVTATAGFSFALVWLMRG